MLDRVNISFETESNTIHYEFKDKDGTVVVHSAIPMSEWKEMRDNIIRNCPPGVQFSTLVDYLAVLGDLAEMNL